MCLKAPHHLSPVRVHIYKSFSRSCPSECNTQYYFNYVKTLNSLKYLKIKDFKGIHGMCTLQISVKCNNNNFLFSVSRPFVQAKNYATAQPALENSNERKHVILFMLM